MPIQIVLFSETLSLKPNFYPTYRGQKKTTTTVAYWGILSVGQEISFGYVLLCLHFLEVECISGLGEEMCRWITLSDTAPHGRSEYSLFPHLQGTADTSQPGCVRKRDCKSRGDKDTNGFQFSEGNRSQEDSGVLVLLDSETQQGKESICLDL